MAIIVKMPAPRARTMDATAPQNNATILFFTGIRYVRDTDDEADEAEIGAPATMRLAADEASMHAAV